MSVKDTSQAAHGKKIFTNHISNNGLVSRMYSELSKVNKTLNTHTQFKSGQELGHITKKDIQMATNHMRRFPALAVR